MRLRQGLVLLVLCLSAFVVRSQTPSATYDRRWSKVDSLINRKGLTESALTEVNNIYSLATKERNDGQQIKALIYRLDLARQKSEDAGPASIEELEKEVAGAGQPAKAILENISANAYWDYFQQNRFRFYNRSNTGAFVKNDIASWSAADFRKKITALFQSSLTQEQALFRIKPDAFSPIIVKGNARNLRPTLFDLLAHNALEHFSAGEMDIDKPANAFEIEDTAAFSDAGTFAVHSFSTSDSSSEFMALELFQRLMRLHLTDIQPDALLDVDIERLQFVHEKATMEDKDERYMAALSRLTARWGGQPAAAEAWYLIAAIHADKARYYHPPRDTTGRYGNVLAKSICEKVIAQMDSSEGKSNCIRLMKGILEKALSMQVETVNLPDQPLRCLVKWTNISMLYGRIFRIDEGFGITESEDRFGDAYWRTLLKRPLMKSFSQALPATGDYQSHNSEIKIDALPMGEYAFLACSDPAFPIDEHSREPLAVVFFHVSAISIVSRERDFFVLDRQGGQPLVGATVQVWDNAYDQKSKRNIPTRKEMYITDQHGHFFIKASTDLDGSATSLEIRAGKDHLFVGINGFQNYSFYRVDREAIEDRAYERENRKTYFFTDRAIYRPGQTVFFKGIMVTRDAQTRRFKTISGFRTKVMLRDVNYRTIDSMEVESNAFGSYHGQFSIPTNLLNGRFLIETDSGFGQNSFAVEEYKRPKFYVGFDTLRTNYRIGDSIRLEGYANAIAGNALDGALVSYKVVRQVHFSYPCAYCVPLRSFGAAWAGWGPSGRAAVQEVAHGVAKANVDGKFRIGFVATAGRGVTAEADPVFEYTVTAVVTDISNETHIGTAVVRAGYRTFEIGIAKPDGDKMAADSLKKLVIRANNLSGVAQTPDVAVTIYPLRAPDRLIRERYWEAPDQHLLAKEAYMQDFPHDQYAEETNIEKWERGEKVFQATGVAGHTLVIADGRGKMMMPGWYLIEAQAKDLDGQMVKASRYIELYDGATGRPANLEYNWSLPTEESVEPGGKVNVGIGSSADKVFVIRTIDRPQGGSLSTDDTKRSFDYFNVDNGRKTEDFSVTEADRGGFGVADVFVKDNRLYTRTFTVTVPWTNKKLAISYSSFRNKALPGSEEKWALAIKGPEGDRVGAEVLTGMYDASLDAFSTHVWEPPALYFNYHPGVIWEGYRNFDGGQSKERFRWPVAEPGFVKLYDRLLNSAFEGRLNCPGCRVRLRETASAVYKDVNISAQALAPASAEMPHAIQIPDLEADPDGSKGLMRDNLVLENEPLRPTAFTPVPGQVRKDFRETAFFFPDLRTDSAGNVSFNFTMPEALTTWKWLTLAGTRDAAFGYSEQTVVTQKQLMVEPNAPRFLREGDKIELPVKVINMTDSELTGQMSLQLTDPTTGETADGWFVNRQPNQYFTVGARQSVVVAFPLDIPFQYNRPLTYKVVAEARNYSDGEEATLPVVSNRLLVTESLPLNMPGDGVRHFTFDKLLKSGSSETLNNHALTVEFTANPAWYAVQSLPYLLERSNECSEQVFSRFYANALASKIANASPRLQKVFARWRDEDTTQLLSNLEKNEELKTVLLAETPWVLEGKTESQQKKALGMLFDMDRMSKELDAALDKLAGMQLSDGSFPWFAGGPGDRYITQYILTGIGHLLRLKAVPPVVAAKMNAIVKAALPWLDGLVIKDFAAAKAADDRARKSGGAGVTGRVGNSGAGRIGSFAIQYLYMRSLFPDPGVPGNVLPAMNYYRKKLRTDWVDQNKYLQGMIALALYRTGDVQTGKDIIASLKQNAIRDEEQGMYWKGMEGGYYWYNAPVETQALLIEAFREIGFDAGIDRALKTWLLRQKQTHNWATTTATADACYALLLGGEDWLNAARSVELKLGDKTVDFAATGGDEGVRYNKKVFDGAFVNPSMGNITVTMLTKGFDAGAPASGGAGAAGKGSPAWGAVYWQYFDMLDRITPPGGGARPVLSIRKRLFVKRNTDRGPVLDSLADNGTLKPGDQVVVRVELRADRDLEYVHMKDMRAACMEPVDVISGYRWQNGLGYYESTKDVSTEFYFDRLPRGVHVFEYGLSVAQAGNFSNGITSVECMYAPEFSFHSEGIRVNVDAAP